DLAGEVVEHLLVMRLGEKADDVGRHVLADPVHIEQMRARWAVGIPRRLHFAPPGFERAVMPREEARRRLADLRDAERVDESVDRNAPALVDSSNELVGAD